MTNHIESSWVVLLALGAFHGINPGMGWLFAVALGIQERRRSAILRALLPLGAGHALAVAAAVGVALAVGVVAPIEWLHWLTTGVLVLLGSLRVIRHRHPRSGMRVGIGGLTWWSFLVANAHGAGLMVIPVFVSMNMNMNGHMHYMPAISPGVGTALIATGLHALGYLVVTALAAVLVFEKLGVGILRRAWFNLDLIWAATLIATGVLTAIF